MESRNHENGAKPKSQMSRKTSKNKNMKKISIYFLVAIIVASIWSCSKKSSDSTPAVVDLGTSASGTYTGHLMFMDTIPGTVVITKASNITVNIQVTGEQSPLNYSGVNLTNGGNGVIVLALGTDVAGTVNGKTLNATFESIARFIGTKP